MKTALVLATLALGAVGDCDWSGGAPGVDPNDCPTDVRLNVGGRNVDTGTVAVTNNDTDLFVVITGANGWKVDEWHVFAGTGSVPLNSGGSPTIGRFPYSGDPHGSTGQVVVTIPLADLGAACGTNINLAVHSVMTKRSLWSTTSETAWAEWDLAFPGARWGGTYGYTLCCGDSPEPDPVCVKTPSYWAQTPDAWPAGLQQITLGSSTYTKQQALDLLALDWQAQGQDISIYMAQQTVAARVNAAFSGELPPEVASALAAVDEWFVSWADADGSVPYGVHAESLEGILGASAIDRVVEYNAGMRGVAPCSGEVPEQPPVVTDCVKLPWYWGQHPAAWPDYIDSLELGSTSYSKAELLTILYGTWWDHGGDVSVLLAHLTVAGRLNAEAVTNLPIAAADALDAADAWFDANADVDGKIAFGVYGDSPAGAAGLQIAEALFDFNEGRMGYPVCQ